MAQTVPLKAEGLFEWIKKQPSWGGDALRRLASSSFNDSDKDKVLINLKKEHGIIEENQQTDIIDFSDDSFQKKADGAQAKTLLCSIGPLKNVNRLADDQVMEFATDGITLVYGDNGSGKSGYCKIGKKLCRALVKDTILSNVFQEELVKAEVKLKYQVGSDAPIEETWIDETEPPEPVSQLSVFDSKCARLYVDKDNKIEYLPAEIELLQKYTELLDELKRTIQPEIDTLRKNASVPLPSGFAEGTDTSKLIKRLTIETADSELPTERDIENLANEGGNVDDNNIQQLKKQLTDNPATKLAALKTLSASLTQLSGKIASIEEVLSESGINALKSAFETAETTAKAASLAASEDFSDEKLPNTGADPWKQMYRYAVEYAKSIDSGNNRIPSEVDDLCLLCQQPLDEDASKRLKKFETFIENRASTDAQLATQKLKERTDAINGVNVPDRTEYQAYLEQYASLSEERKANSVLIETFFSDSSALLAEVKTCIQKSKFSQPNQLVAPISQRLKDDISILESEINTLEQERSDDQHYARIQESLNELQDKKRFVADVEIFAQRLKDLNLLMKLNKCIASLDTTSTSRKITALRKTFLTEELKENISEEVRALDLAHIPFNIDSKTERGATLVGVNLKSSISAENGDVLSEGEQKALALSCFLAEIKREPIQHGIIIDDPVSSLDHIRIRRVAERLAMEAENRQVIIFTHNILFYNEVRKFATEGHIPCLEHYIHKSEEKGFGVVDSTNKHWHAMSVKDRIGKLKDKADNISNKTYADDEERRCDIKDFYSDLRETWERLVEALLLNNVITRYDSGVRTQSLGGVVVEDSDYETVYWAMKKASEHSGHDQADGNTHPLPTNDDLRDDIEKIDEFQKMIVKRRKKCEDKRKKSIQNPPTAETA